MAEQLSHDQLAKKRCRPCEGDVLGYAPLEVLEQIKQLPLWRLELDDKWIARTVRFKNFERALEFLNAVAELAQKEGHHPDLHLIRYREVKVALSTHALENLSENDFIMAAKIDQLITTTFTDAKVSE